MPSPCLTRPAGRGPRGAVTHPLLRNGCEVVVCRNVLGHPGIEVDAPVAQAAPELDGARADPGWRVRHVHRVAFGIERYAAA